MPTRSDAESNLALARAVVARALKLRMQAPGPDPRPEDGEDREILKQAADVLEESPLGPLHAATAALRQVETDCAADPQEAFELVFGHTLRGQVCPYESEYGRRAEIQQAQELADLTGFYWAFGLRMSKECHERPDHVAAELDFVEFLSTKEALAIGNRDDEMLEVTRRALATFLRQHLARFGRAFAASLQRIDPDGRYGSVGRLLAAFLALQCERLGIPAGPELLELRAPDPEVAAACDSGDGLVQIGDGAATSGGW